MGACTDGNRGVIRLNGKPQVLTVETLAELLGKLGYESQQQGVAVAINRQVIPRGQWSGQRLGDGDEVDIVGAVQGG